VPMNWSTHSSYLW